MSDLNKQKLRRTIIEEVKLIQRRKMLVEAKNTIDAANYYLPIIQEMKKRGYSENQINESILGSLVSLGQGAVDRLPQALTDSFKSQIITIVVNFLGLGVYPNLRTVVVNILERLSTSDFMGYFDKEKRCPMLVKKISNGIAEGIFEVLFEKATDVGTQSDFIGGSLRELIGNAVVEFALPPITKKLQKYFCGPDAPQLQDFLKGAKGKATEIVKSIGS